MKQPGYYGVNFSPEAAYYVLSYKGPEVPWTRLLQVGNSSKSKLVQVTSYRLTRICSRRHLAGGQRQIESDNIGVHAASYHSNHIQERRLWYDVHLLSDVACLSILKSST